MQSAFFEKKEPRLNATVKYTTSSAVKSQYAWKKKAKQWREEVAHHEAEAEKSNKEAAVMERLAYKMMKQRDVQRDRLKAAREKLTVYPETRDGEARG